ncbi:efflux RND transporter periplasmic adaptor subunit [Marinimicrobium agarilyticum]|uniref:efflux RND transporter periplasmic adaptor subunit n=1 Tax=Marinimicrobium agarilyticum TaxID=306546 RepID=UPI00040007DC|nr:efflux RND transporter periplasmic adaptor subunit [Marinimicrobium agarilyticum]
MTKRMILMLVAVGIVFGAVFGWKAFGNYMMGQYFANMPEQAIATTATEVKASTWSSTTTAVGSFKAVNGAQLTTEAGGIVTEVHFENGEPVEKGQLLVSLDTETDRAELKRLQAAARLATLELQRYRRLFEEGNSSESELQRRQSEAQQAQASLEAQEARIRQKMIRAPFSGRSGIRQVNVGQYVSVGSPVVAVQALDPIYLQFTLPTSELPQISEQQAVNARVDAYSNDTFQGVVTAIEPSINEATRSFTVQATLENPEHKLRPGMFGRVTLTLGEPKDLKVVPQTAVQFDPYGNSAYVLYTDEDGKTRVKRRFIKTGERRGDLVEVVDGLKVGERIATSGLLKLSNDALVNVNNDPAVQPSSELNPNPGNK